MTESVELTRHGPDTENRPETDADPAVSVLDLTKIYGSGENEVRAVDSVSFDIEPGTVVGLLGPNGAGKTTTIKTLLGLVIPTTGEVTIAGTDVHADQRSAYRHVGAMLEGARNVYWRLTVRENLAFFARLAGIEPGTVRDRHDRLLEQLNLTEKADEPVNDLSRGMKQKVALACALARETPVVFLDEPTLGLDVESSLELRREIRRLAEEESRTVVLSSHDMDVIEDVCDRVLIMSGGRVIADNTVENLIDLFRTQAYRITVEGEMKSETRRELEHGYKAGDWRSTGDRTTIEIALSDGGAFYRLMADLERAGVVIASVESVEPDFEDVFIELTEEAGRGSASQ
jgi:ABC-2 type transport system ATP-binding protein